MIFVKCSATSFMSANGAWISESEEKMKKKGLQCSSIGRRLLLVMAFICIIPLITIGITANVQSKSKLTEKLSTMSEEALSFISENLDEYFKTLEQIIDISSKSIHLRNIDKKGEKEKALILFKEINDSKDDIDYIYFSDIEDEIFTIPHVDFPASYRATQRDWFIQAKGNPNKAIISMPYIDAITGKTIVTISKAVQNDGKVIGVIAADFKLKAIAEQVSSKKIGRTGYLFMFDSNGIVVSHPNHELLGKEISSVNADFAASIKNQKDGRIQYRGMDGKEHFGFVATNKTTGWTICTSILVQELDDDTYPIRITTIFLTLIMGLISIVIAFFISRNMSKHICNLVGSFESAANGDLTIRINSRGKDEFAKLSNGLDSMLENVSVLLENVVKSADRVMDTSSLLANNASEVSAATEDVAKSVGELSQGAINQAESAQNGLFEMENVARQLDYITENSEKIHKIFTYTKDLSETGFKTIDTLTEKSEDAKTATNEVSKVVDDMYNSSLQISNISDALASITAQTNLLSLNAGIEAARAGDAGRGFAVVANEIRKLAEESKTSTEEIKAIIEGIQSKASQVADSIKVTREVVKAQDIAVSDTKEIFGKILNSISEMSEKVSDISVAIRQTAENKDKLLNIMHNVSSVSQESAASTQELNASSEEISANIEEFARYAEELKKLSDDLHSEIHRFRI